MVSPRSIWILSLSAALLSALPLPAQLGPGPSPSPGAGLLSNPAMPPGTQFLFDLEARFARETAAGGGKAFASWFAADAVTLNNGQAPVAGQDAIARSATWSPADFQLTWTPDGGQMSPSGDMGFTWGHYEGHSKDHAGNPVVQKGRYMTVWKKQPDGAWKVELDSSNTGPPDAGDCCKVP